MGALVFCLADSSFYKKNSFTRNDIFLSPDEGMPDNLTSFRIPAGSPPIEQIYSLYPRLPQRPDFIFIKTDALGRNFIRGLGSLGVPVVASLADTHHLHRPLERLIEYVAAERFDLISIENDRHHLKWYSRFGINNLCWLPNLALHPYKMPVLSSNNEKRVNRICFVGSMGKFHPYRRFVVSQLSLRFPGLVNAFSATRESASDAYNRYLISINVSLNSDLNWRFFEILAAGGFLLTDRLPAESGVDLLFKEGIHYEAFGSISELFDKVDYYLKYPLEAHRIASAGYGYYWSRFSPSSLRKEMLRRIFGYKGDQLFSAPGNFHSVEKDNLVCLLRAYQICQELHRISIKVKILYSCEFWESLTDDLLDFPRLSISTMIEGSKDCNDYTDVLLLVNDFQDVQIYLELASSKIPKLYVVPLCLLKHGSYGQEWTAVPPAYCKSITFNEFSDCYIISLAF